MQHTVDNLPKEVACVLTSPFCSGPANKEINNRSGFCSFFHLLEAVRRPGMPRKKRQNRTRSHKLVTDSASSQRECVSNQGTKTASNLESFEFEREKGVIKIENI